MLKWSLKIICLIVFTLMFNPAVAWAAPPDPGDSSDVPAPIDGGASLLLAGAVAYGAKKIKERKSK